jgi:hypothetical protein
MTVLDRIVAVLCLMLLGGLVITVVVEWIDP